MSSAPIDVLGLMLQAETRCGPALSDAVLEARDAVAELLAADREYDSARRNWDNATAGDPESLTKEQWEQVADRFEAAVMRRIAALAKFPEAAHGAR